MDVMVNKIGKSRWKYKAEVRGWQVSGHVERIEGRLTITDLRFQVADEMPEGGLTTDDLRAVKTSAIYRAVRVAAAESGRDLAGATRGGRSKMMMQPPRGDELWQIVAEIRLAAEADPSATSVTRTVAERLGPVMGREVPLATAKTYMRRAAIGGWLEGVKPGRRGALPGHRLFEARAHDKEGAR